MKYRIQIRLRTNWQKATMPVKRPPCPICQTIERIHPTPLVKVYITRLKRGGPNAHCPKCRTYFVARVKANPKRWMYEAVVIGILAREQLANSWMATHKTPLPKVLRLQTKEATK